MHILSTSQSIDSHFSDELKGWNEKAIKTDKRKVPKVQSNNYHKNTKPTFCASKFIASAFSLNQKIVASTLNSGNLFVARDLRFLALLKVPVVKAE